ncbi:MAG: Ku protein [Bacillota bacterium]
MRAMWNGAISFGLVTIPIKLFTATEDKEVKFNYLHKPCKTPIKYEKVCPSCQKEVKQEEIVRGYEYEKGRYIVISDEDLQQLPLETIKSIQILDFVDMNEVDPIYFMKSYFAVPDAIGVKPYRLLLEAMARSGKAAVAKVVLRTKENLALVRIYQNCLLLSTLHYHEEVRSVGQFAELEGEVKFHANELKMAESLVKSLSAPFEPAKYASDYRKALTDLIQAKINQDEVVVPERPQDKKIIDLVEALRASVAAVEAERKPATPKKKRLKAAGD